MTRNRVFILIGIGALIVSGSAVLFFPEWKELRSIRQSGLEKNPLAALSAPGDGAHRRADPSADQSTRVQLLDEIIRSGNENDPRLDTEFQGLSEDEKAAVRKIYSRLKPEDLNQRGILIAVLGENLRSVEDLRFMKSVLSEPICLSPTDCSRADPHSDEEPDAHTHGHAVEEILLAYPQLVAMRAVEKAVEVGGVGLAPEARDEAAGLYRELRDSALNRLMGGE